ncbi:aspartate ammonia-lyase [Marinobacterium rhizophilum]
MNANSKKPNKNTLRPSAPSKPAPEAHSQAQLSRLPAGAMPAGETQGAGGAQTPASTRREKDLLGERDVPASAYFGIQTLRAVENFTVTGITLQHFPKLVIALAMVKKAAALANRRLGQLDDARSKAICQACDEIIAGRWHEHFVVDVIQGGAGTSTNMNANEVIANRALELMGHGRGEYQQLHPNNHVNLSQSTNDVYPSAIRLCILLSYERYTQALGDLCYELKHKSVEFSDVIKMGRTQLQDAVPITLGQEFGGWHATLKEDIEEMRDVVEYFREVNMGATAIGTGINTDPEYSSLVIEELCRVSGKSLVAARNLIEATSDMGAFVTFSSVLKRNAIKLSKVCNDLRLLSSGPRAGLQEINLPAMQPGSSIMPGKVNPVIPEMVNQVAYQVIGNDITVTMAAEAGQLQLNVMEPVIAFNVLQSLQLQTRAIRTLAEKCISGISANREHCRDRVNNSIGIITALNPFLGYENASRIAKQAVENGQSVRDIVLSEGLLTELELDDILSAENMTQPRRLKKNNQPRTVA